MRPLRKLEVWLGKTSILGPIRMLGTNHNSIALTAVTPCQSVLPGFGKGLFRPYLKKSASQCYCYRYQIFGKGLFRPHLKKSAMKQNAH